MTQGARWGTEGDPSVLGCPTGHRHRFRLAGGAVQGLALRCPDCAERSAAEQMAEIVAARRQTLAGLAGLPRRTRADLAASGALAKIYSSTVTAVREAADHCRHQTGVEPPACLRPGEPPAGGDRARATAVLDAAADWLARLPR